MEIDMKLHFRTVFLLFAVGALAACSPARTGVINDTLTTTYKPGLAITTNKPLALASSGKIWAPVKGDDIAAISSAIFDYALYVDPTVSPAEKFAYAAFIRLEDKARWMFQPQGHGLPGQFGAGKSVLPEGREGKIYTLHVPSQNDWASDVLRENGHTPPEAWLVKLWVYSLDSDARAMAEYREPWPEYFEVPSSDIMLLNDTSADFLRNFEKRAVAAFVFDATSADFSGVPQSAPAWKTPRVDPDAERLVGDIIRITHGGDAEGWDR
jgi:hypothetical protein